MSIWNAARELLAGATGPNRQELAAHTDQLVTIESLLEKELGTAVEQGASAAASLRAAEVAVGAALDEFSRRLAQPAANAIVDVKDASGLARELDRLKQESISRAFKATAGAIAHAAAWPQQIKAQLEPHLAGVRGFATKVRQVRPVVLVIEDDDFARKLIAQAMEGEDYVLVFASDGATALGMLRRVVLSVILMDINLPDIDGIALTRNMKAAPHLAAISVLMLTGDATRETLADSMSAGASDFIVKPFTREALVFKLTRILSPGA